MADESLLGVLGNQDLLSFNQQVMQSDPYGIAGSAIGSWRPNASTWSPGTTAATAFGQAFLSGLLRNYAQQNAAEQTNKLIGVLPQLRADPMSVVAPEGINQGAFAQVRANAVLRNQLAEAQQRQSIADMMLKMGIAGETAKLEAAGQVLGKQSAYNALGQGGINPESPGYKAQQDAASMTDSLRKEVSGLPEVKNFKEVANRFDALKRGLLDKNAITDTDFAISLAKIYDPTSVVRESESGQVIDSQSIPTSILGRINKALTGEQALDTSARLALIGSAKRHYDTQKGAFETAAEQYRALAGTRGLDASQIVPSLGSSYSYGEQDLRELASRFPPTPEGRAAFKEAMGLLR